MGVITEYRQTATPAEKAASPRVRVALYCPSTGNAMNHLIQSIVPELSAKCEVLLIVPSHYPHCQNHRPAVRYPARRNKIVAAFRECNVFGALRLWRQILKWKPDVLHIFNGDGYPWTIALACLAKCTGVPVILTVHDPEAHPKEILDWIDSTLRLLTYKFIAATHLFSDRLMHKLPGRVRSKATFILPHWSTEALFTRFRAEDAKRSNTIVFFGRVAPYKGLNTLVRATVLLKGRFRTVIAGSGHLDSESRRIMEKFPQLFERRDYFVFEPEIASLLENAAVCALPHIHVTQSSAPMIAAAFGVPVVASNIGGFLDDVSEENGCLVPPGDPQAFAEAVLAAVDKRPAPMKDRNLEMASDGLRDIYRSVLRSCL